MVYTWAGATDQTFESILKAPRHTWAVPVNARVRREWIPYITSLIDMAMLRLKRRAEDGERGSVVAALRRDVDFSKKLQRALKALGLSLRQVRICGVCWLRKTMSYVADRDAHERVGVYIRRAGICPWSMTLYNAKKARRIAGGGLSYHASIGVSSVTFVLIWIRMMVSSKVVFRRVLWCRCSLIRCVVCVGFAAGVARVVGCG